jgi:murein DD-endopeptidase MepM/ murein hydrolase activator NlpD
MNSFYGTGNINLLAGPGGQMLPGIRKSGFSNFFKQKNRLDEAEFAAWFFLPGMRFNSWDKWWGDFGKRQTPHEGLDLCLYTDQQNRLFSVGVNTKVPAMFHGVVVAVIDDFLGKSVVVEHDFSGALTKRFCTLYAHTVVRHGLAVGMAVRKGDVLATVADTTASTSKIPPHVHISAGFLENGASYGGLNWLDISQRRQMALFDPLALLQNR